MVFAESFTAEVTCCFPGRLSGHFRRRARLVVDGHSAAARGGAATGSPPAPTRSGRTSCPRTHMLPVPLASLCRSSTSRKEVLFHVLMRDAPAPPADR
ncbi:hypothetical protein APS67_003174 [Streptomyces sp. AVP053U2]|nr:hypothetical protein APS67_003174 [Streptomyces sp. AVP053U2]